MKTAKVFRSGNSMAVRLPKEFYSGEKEFLIRKMGNSIFLIPKSDPWGTLEQGISEFSEDFLKYGRNQPDSQNREEL